MLVDNAVHPPISDAARRLLTAESSGVPCAPVRDVIGVDDIDAAYAIQASITEQRTSAGRHRVGRKIGLTSAAVQRQFGVYEPDFGVLLDDMLYADRERIPLARYCQPRVEAEVAFVLGADLDLQHATVAGVLRATEFLLPAIEIVDSRIADWDITITDTIADNASSGAVVLGTTPHAVDAVDLPGLGMVLEHDGHAAATGAGVACLGSPVNAVAWLARTVALRGDPLRAGEIVLSGALGPMVPVTGSGSYRARLSGLGDVHARFSAEEGSD